MTKNLKQPLHADLDVIVEYVTTLCFSYLERISELEHKLAKLVPDEVNDVISLPNKNDFAAAIKQQLLNRSYIVHDGTHTHKFANLAKVVTDIGLDVVLATLHHGIGFQKFLMSEFIHTVDFIDKVNGSEYTPGTYRKSAVKKFKRLENVREAIQQRREGDDKAVT